MLQVLKTLGSRLLQAVCYILHYAVDPRGARRRAQYGPPYFSKKH